MSPSEYQERIGPLVVPAGNWAPYEFPEGDARAGIVSQVAFANPGVVAADKRVRESRLEVLDVASGRRESVYVTRDHIEAILPLAAYPGFGRFAVLHDETGTPSELYFWGFSGD